MKKSCLTVFVLAMALLASCSKEDIYVQDTDAVEIDAKIIPLRTARVQVSDEGAGSFSYADRITLLVTPQGANASSHELAYTADGWTPQLSWGALQADAASFTGVYPALSGTVTEQILHEVKADQRDEASYRASDLLVAQAQAKRGERVNLDFYHQMNRVVVNLSSVKGAFSDEELASAEVSLKARRQIVFNARTAGLGEVQGETDRIILHHVSGTAFHAIVCPQPVLSEWRDKGWIEIQIGSEKLVYKAPSALNGDVPFNGLEPGKQVVFNLKLDKKEAGGGGDETDWRNKTCWVEGLKNMPPLNEWGYYLTPEYEQGKPVNEIFALEWKREYGWYDCNKLDPTGPTYNDQNYCWAATCSNMIYWWLDRNADHLNRFGYKGPHTYVSDKECEVFQFFKDHFNNKGLNIKEGLNWFLCGTPVSPGSTSAQPVKPHPGFFKEVLKNPSVVRTAVFGGYELTANLKKAFMDKEAIGLSILLNRGTEAHAITVWGAGFDDKGEVNMLYIAENNDVWANEYPWPMKPGKLGNAGIFTKRVRIDESGKAFVEGGKPGACTIEINYMAFLGMHTQEWEDYFNRQ